MSVRCYKCASSFGIFNKEIGCKKCGYAFCKKCVTKKVTLPNQSKQVSVCDKCYDIATGKKPPVNAAQYSPPEALAKRLAAAEGSQSGRSQSCTVQQQNRSTSIQYKGMSNQDIELAKRLDKLKEDRKANTAPVPSQIEIENRLACLKGSHSTQSGSTDAATHDPDQAYSRQNFIHLPNVRPNGRSQQEQIDSLLEEIGNEVEIDSRLERDRIQSIEERLGKLKGGNGQSVPSEAAASGLNSDLRNNLNMQPAAKPYTDKLQSWNISTNEVEGDSEKASDWLEVKRLMESVSHDLDADATKAVEELQKDKELWGRVKDLKKSRKQSKSSAAAQGGDDKHDSDNDNDSEDDEKIARSICKQILEEIRIEDSHDEPVAKSKTSARNKNAKSKVSSSSPTEEGDEMIWCCICNDDATLRCKACDNDLYCERCFKEGHSKYDLKDGHARSYLKKR